jgi:hypothetical protein
MEVGWDGKQDTPSDWAARDNYCHWEYPSSYYCCCY